MAKINTGSVDVIDVPLPRPTKGGKFRGGMDVRPGVIAVHPGDDPAELRAFAAHLVASWESYRARHAS